MNPPPCSLFGLTLLIAMAGLPDRLIADDKKPGDVTSKALVARIDQQIDAGLTTHSITAAGPADDYEFLRRVFLDLTGRIPTVHEVRSFVEDPQPDRRALLVDQLLERPRHSAHLARVWRDWLVPELATIPEARHFQPGFEAWLAARFRERVGYDTIVRELISVPLPGTKEQAEYVFRQADRPNPLAFYAVKDAQPDKLAATATRAFLSIQLECAQCHNHPFAEWKQEQFWNQAAFFAGIERQGNGLFAPLTEDPKRRAVSPGEGKPSVGPAYLFGRTESIDPGNASRAAFANWLTARDNPYFARSAVNRAWALLFGVGLVHPIDDFHNNNPASHPAILDELARAFVAADCDLDFLFRVLCQTKAYQRTSAWRTAEAPDSRHYARMLTKGLSADQAWDSLSLAVGWTTVDDRADNANEQTRRRFIEQFTPRSWPAEPETSIGQALSLMNGGLISRATRIDQSPTLIAITETPGWTEEERLTSLYLIALGRPPESGERDKLLQFLSRSGDGRASRYEDLFWMLLNSAEFRLNH
jgi:hypothetical protein